MSNEQLAYGVAAERSEELAMMNEELFMNKLLKASLRLFFANVKKEGALKAKVYGLEQRQGITNVK